MPEFDDATNERHADLVMAMAETLTGLTVYEAARVIHGLHGLILAQASEELRLHALLALANHLGFPIKSNRAFMVPGNDSIN